MSKGTYSQCALLVPWWRRCLSGLSLRHRDLRRIHEPFLRHRACFAREMKPGRESRRDLGGDVLRQQGPLQIQSLRERAEETLTEVSSSFPIWSGCGRGGLRGLLSRVYGSIVVVAPAKGRQDIRDAHEREEARVDRPDAGYPTRGKTLNLEDGRDGDVAAILGRLGVAPWGLFLLAFAVPAAARFYSAFGPPHAGPCSCCRCWRCGRCRGSS